MKEKCLVVWGRLIRFIPDKIEWLKNDHREWNEQHPFQPPIPNRQLYWEWTVGIITALTIITGLILARQIVGALLLTIIGGIYLFIKYAVIPLAVVMLVWEVIHQVCTQILFVHWSRWLPVLVVLAIGLYFFIPWAFYALKGISIRLF